jgi:hypothetical protein
MKRLLLALLLSATINPAFAQVKNFPNNVQCNRCTAQCTMCGMGATCNDTCNKNGNGYVKYGKKYCTSWFENCNNGKPYP